MNVRRAQWLDDGAALVAIRRHVFIEEQGVPESLEWDGLDPGAVHFLAVSTSGAAIGTVRLVRDAAEGLHLGRMAVLDPWRRQGVGSALLYAALDWARAEGVVLVRLNAQLAAQAFYMRAGFVAVGEVFDDAGIPHRAMQRYL